MISDLRFGSVSVIFILPILPTGGGFRPARVCPIAFPRFQSWRDKPSRHLLENARHFFSKKKSRKPPPFACCRQQMPAIRRCGKRKPLRFQKVRRAHTKKHFAPNLKRIQSCLLYTSDAADDLLCVDLGG